MYIHVCCCWFRCSGTGKQFWNRKETSCLPLLNAGFEAGKSQTPIRQQTECIHIHIHIHVHIHIHIHIQSDPVMMRCKIYYDIIHSTTITEAVRKIEHEILGIGSISEKIDTIIMALHFIYVKWLHDWKIFIGIAYIRLWCLVIEIAII